jgi:hypothetical protein
VLPTAPCSTSRACCCSDTCMARHVQPCSSHVHQTLAHCAVSWLLAEASRRATSPHRCCIPLQCKCFAGPSQQFYAVGHCLPGRSRSTKQWRAPPAAAVLPAGPPCSSWLPAPRQAHSRGLHQCTGSSSSKHISSNTSLA